MKPVHLWTFQAAAGWLELHERELEELAPGRVAMISRPGRARSVIEVVCENAAMAARLRRRFGGSSVRLPRDWEKKFLETANRPPLRLGRRLLVVAHPQSRPNDRAQLMIPAAGAFGTGDHATTAMCLRLLEEVTRKFPSRWRMLDLGSGTGILALAASRFGAGGAVGIDNDPRAIAHASENARLNEISSARFVRHDLLRWKPRARFDLITANLFSELLIAAAPKFRRALRAGGVLIASGILRDQAEDVVRALRRAGFRIEQQRRRGKWIALRCNL